MIATSHASIFHSEADTLIPSESALMVSTIGVTGLMLAKTCNHEGMVAIGTYKELAKTEYPNKTGHLCRFNVFDRYPYEYAHPCKRDTE